MAGLRLLCRDEVALIEERTALINQLQSALREYYPAALEAFEDWTMLSAWAFVEAFPTPQALVSAGKRKWEKFLHTEHLARPQTYQKRMEIFAHAAEFVSGQALTRAKSRLALARVRMLRVLQSQIDSYRAQIEKLFAQHPDHDLFGSLPGAGPKIAPRLLGEIGSDRSRFEDPCALQCLAGTAPVSYQSGTDPQGLSAATLQQAAPPRRASMGQPESEILSVGRRLLRAAPHTRQEPRLRPTLPRSTLAKNPLENVADRHAL